MSNRKLLTEVERTLKKVVEGIGEFEVYLDKLNASTTSSQKERWESELKKEIKKLQRFRDQIKTWQLSAEIKDKDPLNESRRSIEVLMEKFKSLEKDLKIKAYSKEGLIAKSKIDPREKEKLEAAGWISTVAVERLKTQVDAFEAELEASFLNKKTPSAGAAGKRAAAVEHKPGRQVQLERLVERHKYHIDRLELLLRMLENEDITYEDILEIKDRVEYYIDANDHPEFEEDETMYDDFDFEAKGEELKGNLPSSGVASSLEDAPPSDKPEHPALRPDPSPDTAQSAPIHVPTPKSQKWNPKFNPKYAHKPHDHVGAGNVQAMSPPPTAVSAAVEPIKVWSNMPKSVISAVDAPNKRAEEKTPTAPAPPRAEALPSASSVSTPAMSVHAPAPAPVGSDASILAEDWHARLMASFPKEKPTRTAFFAHAEFSELESLAMERHAVVPEEKRYSEMESQLSFSGMIHQERPLSGDPETTDNPFHFPTARPPVFDQPSFYERLDLDTLFSIFYYLPRTYSQYLAARELKRQSWRFHKKYLTWFQRHEEPKVITEDYEQGTYIYFDYEGSWCQRKKSEFTFEYRFLEDAELV